MKRLTPIQKFARGQDCYLRIPNVHRSAPDNETTVLAHAPHANRAGMRDSDWFGCPACFECHEYADGRSHGGYGVGRVDWTDAIWRWLRALNQAGLVWLGETDNRTAK